MSWTTQFYPLPYTFSLSASLRISGFPNKAAAGNHCVLKQLHADYLPQSLPFDELAHLGVDTARGNSAAQMRVAGTCE